jgi:hypothetical protein
MVQIKHNSHINLAHQVHVNQTSEVAQEDLAMAGHSQARRPSRPGARNQTRPMCTRPIGHTPNMGCYYTILTVFFHICPRRWEKSSVMAFFCTEWNRRQEERDCISPYGRMLIITQGEEAKATTGISCYVTSPLGYLEL